jgi:hypothetical protein
MTPDPFPASYEDRLRWAIREGSIIGVIFLFWLGVGLGLLLVTGLVGVAIEAVRIPQLRFFLLPLRWDGAVWSAVVTLASATSGLYVLVRTGTILIDRYRRPVEA